jgi:leucyl-tRNA synthetase
MFMGPFENTVAWSTASIAGTARFIERVWKARTLVQGEDVPALDHVLHTSIKKVTEDIEHFKFNTAVSQLMIFLNALEKEGRVGTGQWSAFIRLLAPIAPHITEELWQELGEAYSIHTASWPQYDASKCVLSTVEVVVQVHGKRRGSVALSPTASEAEALAAALHIEAVVAALKGGKPSRVVYVPGRILNLVI